MTTIPVTLYLMSHYVFIDNQIHLRNKHTETMKKENRQLFRLWLTCLAAVCALNLSAQKFEYPVHGENDTVRIAVSFKGKQPVITDYANAYLESRKDSAFFAEVKEEWDRHLQQAPLSPNVSIVEDVKHGYIHYEKIRPEEQDTLIFEMCFWNCADKKHRMVAANSVIKMEGDYGWDWFVGCEFFLYDKTTHDMREIWPEDIGALYDGDGLSVFFLPRKGKNIKVSAAGGGERWDDVLKWDGYQFNSKNYEDNED